MNKPFCVSVPTDMVIQFLCSKIRRSQVLCSHFSVHDLLGTKMISSITIKLLVNVLKRLITIGHEVCKVFQCLMPYWLRVDD